MSIKIPQGILEKLEQRSKEKGFKTAEEYVVYILQQVVDKFEHAGKTEKLTKEDEAKMKKELQKLGYLE